MNKRAWPACRLAKMRSAFCCQGGLDILARALNLPGTNLGDYRQCVAVPAAVLIGFLEAAGADAPLLLAGEISRLVSRIG